MQLYEIAVLLVVAVVFLRLDIRRWRGSSLLWYLALYGCGQALTEFWRGDFKDRVLLGPLSHFQWLCFAAAGVSAAILMHAAATRRWPRRRPAPG
ncbi:MAG: prolipoprotein diacylglyceryl transferase [Phycisphaerae bacterium]|nr:prolipoprotein diacylglyceryl transferase [Phycisphaerae bacterium]